jgi:hypothetical protein
MFVWKKFFQGIAKICESISLSGEGRLESEIKIGEPSIF